MCVRVVSVGIAVNIQVCVCACIVMYSWGTCFSCDHDCPFHPVIIYIDISIITVHSANNVCSNDMYSSECVDWNKFNFYNTVYSTTYSKIWGRGVVGTTPQCINIYSITLYILTFCALVCIWLIERSLEVSQIPLMFSRSYRCCLEQRTSLTLHN